MLNTATGMFGMLDYRAHKLYRLWTLPARLLENVATVVFLAVCVFFTGPHFTGLNYSGPTTTALVHLLLAILAWLIGGIPIWAVFTAVRWLFNKVFFFTIDVVPAEGRTQVQARAVTFNGNLARYLLHMENFMEWTEDDTRGYVRCLPLLVRLFYSNTISERIDQTVRTAVCLKKSGMDPMDWTEVGRQAGVSKEGRIEKVVTNTYGRGYIIVCVLLLGFFALFQCLGLG